MALACAAALLTGAAAPAAAAPTVHRKKVVRMARHEHRHLSRAARNRLAAAPMVAKRGWSRRQYKCLARLWMRESHWNNRAGNHWSGAYGIPQALPGAKMRSAGSDWRSNPKTQIRWGLGYIKHRYGSPCRAWSHSRSTGWY